jgi:hypothetical protein
MFNLVGLLWGVSMLEGNTRSICKYSIELFGLLTMEGNGINCKI